MKMSFIKSWREELSFRLLSIEREALDFGHEPSKQSRKAKVLQCIKIQRNVITCRWNRVPLTNRESPERDAIPMYKVVAGLIGLLEGRKSDDCS